MSKPGPTSSESLIADVTSAPTGAALVTVGAGAADAAGGASSPVSASTTLRVPGHPSQIGGYRILQLIGEGGMGTIYRAEQRHPVRRIVALKLVKLGMDTKAVIGRFEAERQALAMMDHPNVAKVLDAGATEHGRPYFVMEYVAGLPITTYCNQKKLGTRQRLELFVQVCEAVQHAHHKGVIHRDLKPGNVLVTEHEGRAVPKVIDFGVAKATHGRLTDVTLATEIGGVIGTLGYMSPEQAELSGLDVDTRTDVYSLGVILYELLTGEPPFDPETLRKAAFTEAQRIIREEEPARPSTRLSIYKYDAARRIGTDIEKRVQELRTELDWIPLKALRKDRDERYATPNDLAQDVRRYLAGEPIAAHPPSAAYRLRKQLRRHRGPVAAAAAVLLTLVLGIVGTSWFAVEAHREAERASNAEAEALAQKQVAVEQRQEAEAQRREAQRQQAIAEETNSFLVWMFELADPTSTQGKEITAAELITRAVTHLEERFEEQPQVKLSLKATLGRALFNLGRPAEAVPLLRDAVEGRRRLLGPDDPATLQTMKSLAVVLGNQHNPEAEALLRQVLAARERTQGADHPDTISALNDVCVSLMLIGRFADAEPELRELAQRAARALPPDHRYRLGALQNLGVAVQSQGGRAAEAEALLREALEKAERALGADHPNTLNCKASLAQALMDQKRYEEAAPFAEASLEGLRQRLGPGHWFTKMSAGTMARLYEETGRSAEAVEVRSTYGLPPAKPAADASTQPAGG